MIEKLDKHLAHNINSCNMSQNILVAHKAIEKINELVDAVNGILDYAPLEMAMKAEPKTPADPYAEQRKWIGKLCWVWNDDGDERAFTKLNEIIEDDDDRPFKCFARWKHCEPVKPDDDIIYKGE